MGNLINIRKIPGELQFRAGCLTKNDSVQGLEFLAMSGLQAELHGGKPYLVVGRRK